MVTSFTRQLQGRRRLFKPDLLWWAIIVLGIILRLRQFFSNRSLWADEASLAYNLANRSFWGLTQPLDYEQGAPIAFLVIEKFLLTVFGNIDQVMRLFPLFSGIVSIYLIYRISRLHIIGGMFATLLFAISWQLIYYSTELKQYSSDVMIGLLLVFLATRCLRENAPPKDFLVLGVVGAVTIWISHPSVFILAGIGLALLIANVTQSRPIPVAWLIGLGTLWAVSFGVVYLVSLRHLITDDYLYSYWKKAFMPLPPWKNLEWLSKTYNSLLLMTLNRTDQVLAYLIPVLALIGGLSLLYRDRSVAIILVFPFFAAMLASALQRYPLKDRFMLFLVPFVLLLIVEGLGRIYTIIAKWNIGVALIVCSLPALIIFYLPAIPTFNFFLSPYNWSDIKPIMEYVATKRLNSETIYIYHGAEPAFVYYAPLYGIDPQNVMIGYDTPQKKIALEGFFDDVKKLKGKNKVWFIFSDIYDCGGCEGDMQLFYVNYLNERGTMLDNVNANTANAYLYDLNP